MAILTGIEITNSLMSFYDKESGMTLFILLLLIANILIAYYCYHNAKQKGYPVLVFTLFGSLPYLNLVVLVYLLFLPNLKSNNQLQKDSILS